MHQTQVFYRPKTPFVADFKQKHYQGHFEPRPVFVHPGVSHSPLKLHNLLSSHTPWSHIKQDLLSTSSISHGTIFKSFNSTSLQVRLLLMESQNLSQYTCGEVASSRRTSSISFQVTLSMPNIQHKHHNQHLTSRST